MNAGTITAILTVVLSGGTLTALVALLLFPSQRAKIGAEREAITVASSLSLAGGYGNLVETLRSEITRLETSLLNSRTETELCRREMAQLRALLVQAGLDNGPKP